MVNKITFPILNLELNINRIAFSILGIDIYWYAILIVMAVIVALYICKKQDGKYEIKWEDILDLSIILIPVAFVGARLYYVIFHIENYTNFIDVLNLKDGGLAIYGGIIGGVIVAYIFCKKRKINLLDLLDYIVPSLAIGQSIGRWGNFFNAEAYGSNTNLPWKMGIEINNKMQYVHPTFLYESISTFIIFLILTRISKNRKYAGQITYYYIIMYSFIRAIIEGIRSDSLMLYNFRISQVLSGVLFVTFCIIISKKQIKHINN